MLPRLLCALHTRGGKGMILGLQGPFKGLDLIKDGRHLHEGMITGWACGQQLGKTYQNLLADVGSELRNELVAFNRDKMAGLLL